MRDVCGAEMGFDDLGAAIKASYWIISVFHTQQAALQFTAAMEPIRHESLYTISSPKIAALARSDAV